MVVGIGTIVLAQPDPAPPFKGGVLFDGVLIDKMRAHTVEGRRTAAQVSNVSLWSSVAYPFVDAGLTAALVRGDRYSAGQMGLISLEAFAAIGLVKVVAERLVVRERPYVAACSDRDVPGMPSCDGSDSRKSFFSGHTALSFTGAGLSCAHHLALHLYGGAWDGLACGAAIAVAGLTGTLRMVADRHYATDVLVGAAFGFAAGFLLPRAGYYREGNAPPEPASNTAKLTFSF
jgi:hypothetical protein